MKRIYPLFILLYAVLLLTGCIKEDIFGCPTGVKVYFIYQPTYAGTGTNSSEVEKMNLYVFDSDNILRAVEEDTNPHLSATYYMTVKNLPAGEYRFVAWGNLFGCFTTDPMDLIVGQTTFEQICLVFGHMSGAAVIEQSLFFTNLSGAHVSTERNQQFYLPVEQTTSIINLTTEGLPLNGDNYRFIVTDNNGKYYFDNSYAPDSDFTYTAACDKNAQGQPHTSLRVLKLESGRRVIIELHNMTKGTICYSANLIELLDACAVDYHLQKEFDVHLKFNANMSVDVIIDRWQVTEGGIVLK